MKYIGLSEARDAAAGAAPLFLIADTVKLMERVTREESKRMQCLGRGRRGECKALDLVYKAL